MHAHRAVLHPRRPTPPVSTSAARKRRLYRSVAINDQLTTEQQNTEREYETWLGQIHSPAHARRTAKRNAAFFLPHLTPGMRLLDVGCGPGSITLGLAEAVAPGAVVGIDASAEAVESASRRAEEHGCANVRFEVGDAYALPFEDATFDAAFMHAVLQHLTDSVGALREVRRVLKPDGVIGLADADHDGTIIAPDDPALRRSFEIWAAVREQRRGDVRVGKKLRALLHEAGFERAQASAMAGAEGTAEAARYHGEWQAQYHAAPAFVEYVAAAGIASREEMRAVSEAWRAWGESPGAFWARFWCTAVGWRGT